MKILLIGNFSLDGQYSMQGFVRSLAVNLPDQDIEVSIIAPKAVFSRYVKNIHSGIGKWLGYIDKYVLFVPQLRGAARSVDLVHVCDQGNGIYVSQLGGRVPVVLTCHDLFAIRAGFGDPEVWSLSWTGRIYQKFIWRSIQHATYIACVSESTRADLIRLLPGGKQRICCIPNSLYGSLSRMEDSASVPLLVKHQIDPSQPFLLHVGGNQPYKNRLGLLKIYSAMCRLEPSTPKMVLAGKPFTTEMRAYVKENELSNKVMECSDLDDIALKALYSQAKALLFPSTREGFGLPIIEAQACGCPVFTTGAAPMTEAGGDAAIYFDPQEVESAASIILEGLNDSERLLQMTMRGINNVAARFKLERMVTEYASLYQVITEQDKVGKLNV